MVSSPIRNRNLTYLITCRSSSKQIYTSAETASRERSCAVYSTLHRHPQFGVGYITIPGGRFELRGDRSLRSRSPLVQTTRAISIARGLARDKREVALNHGRSKLLPASNLLVSFSGTQSPRYARRIVSLKSSGR